MIQELFSGGNVGIINGGDQISKFSTTPINGSPSPSPSPSSSAAAGGPTTTTPTPPENLRCPRCDSSNTKFCYYNNYNLTQPRHFCKTCRRYWTKGGALRNVPIGGGCRKNKTTAVTASVAKSGTATKLMRTVSSEMGKNNSGLFGAFESASSNPIIWASSQNSHFLSLLRANQNPNYNHHLPNSAVSVKEEGGGLFGSAYFSSDPSNSLSGRVLGLDPLGPAHFPSTYRNQTTQGIIHGELVQNNNGLQELYQRIKSSSSSTSCFPESGQVILGNVASGNYSSNGSTILESAPVATGDQFGFWNPSNNISWPTDNLQASNGAYPA